MAYVINIDEHADAGTHWIDLFCNKNKIVSVLNIFLKKLKSLLEIKT